MPLEIFIKYAQAVLTDDVDTIKEVKGLSDWYDLEGKLMYLAVYFNSHRCMMELSECVYMGFDFTCIQLAVKSDNEVFIKDYLEKVGCPFVSGTYENLYANAVSAGSTKVAEVFANYLGHEPVVRPRRLYVNKLVNLLENVKKELSIMDMWYLDDYNYDNLLQWLPRELMEDQCFMVTCDALERLYYF